VARFQLDKSAPFIAAAEEACRQAVTLDTAMSEGHLALGDLYVSTGAYVSAESEYRKALRRNPQDPDAYTGLARALGLQNRLPEAEEVYRQAIAIRPTDWNVQSRFAAYLFEHGRVAEAVPYFRRVTELVPVDPRGWSNLGGAELMTADFAAAAESFARSAALQPTSESYSNLGTMYYYLKRFDAAAEAYRQAEQLSPTDYRIAGNLGDALQSSGDAAGARQSYERARDGAQAAVEVNARDADAQAHLAYYLGRLGRIDEARSAAAIAAELAPTNMYVQYYGALVQLAAGDKAAALVALQRAVDLGYPRQLLAPAPELEPLQSDPEFHKLSAR
jgi:tetratricopeptide (TPR) repeat protein